MAGLAGLTGLWDAVCNRMWATRTKEQRGQGSRANKRGQPSRVREEPLGLTRHQLADEDGEVGGLAGWGGSEFLWISDRVFW